MELMYRMSFIQGSLESSRWLGSVHGHSTPSFQRERYIVSQKVYHDGGLRPVEVLN